MTLFMNACAFLVKVLTLPLYIAEVIGLFSFYKRVYPLIVYKFSICYNDKMKDNKRELFRNLDKFYPTKGSLRILEVGCGSGANFEHYPTGSRITCTDPNPHFQKYLKNSMTKNDQLVYDSFIVASGENLKAVEDNSVDVVVCTLVLCSVQDSPKVLQEAKRVLRPGGAFFFLEHVVSDPSSWTYFFQHVIQPFWYYLEDGCETTRATWKHLEAAGFSDLQLRHIQAPLIFIIKPHIVGYAVK
ncbi:N6-adenosine-methyltransferase TMT1A-like isoform X1 [Carassius carassius]|uniref:N6-adenosine-methyltransferase TMT1A-like isoform X1 n=2 Tax=Carassius carassius TaxID=217509 RepID=UPI0028697507|nr:N6-adenosine-methyltransferase TMT1A-like isoform X1 [Carassius carassius]